MEAVENIDSRSGILSAPQGGWYPPKENLACTSALAAALRHLLVAVLERSWVVEHGLEQPWNALLELSWTILDDLEAIWERLSGLRRLAGRVFALENVIREQNEIF